MAYSINEEACKDPNRATGFNVKLSPAIFYQMVDIFFIKSINMWADEEHSVRKHLY